MNYLGCQLSQTTKKRLNIFLTPHINSIGGSCLCVTFPQSSGGRGEWYSQQWCVVR